MCQVADGPEGPSSSAISALSLATGGAFLFLLARGEAPFA